MPYDLRPIMYKGSPITCCSGDILLLTCEFMIISYTAFTSVYISLYLPHTILNKINYISLRSYQVSVISFYSLWRHQLSRGRTALYLYGDYRQLWNIAKFMVQEWVHISTCIWVIFIHGFQPISCCNCIYAGKVKVLQNYIDYPWSW